MLLYLDDDNQDQKILQIENYKKPGTKIDIDLLNDCKLQPDTNIIKEENNNIIGKWSLHKFHVIQNNMGQNYIKIEIQLEIRHC